MVLGETLPKQEMIADNRIALMVAGPLHPNTLKNLVLNAEVFNEIVLLGCRQTLER